MNKEHPTQIVEFARFIGELAENFSFNKSLGQIYGLLYMSPTALSLPEIADTLKISKGNVSLNIRILESWGAVSHVSIHDSRRDFYQANTDIKGLALKRLQEGLGRRFEMAESRIDELSKKPAANPDTAKKIHEFKSMLATARKAMDSLSKFSFLLRK